MKHLTFLFCAPALWLAASAQNPKIDSLSHDLDRQGNMPASFAVDTCKVNSLVLITVQLRNIGEYDKALEYGNKALLLAQNSSYKKGSLKRTCGLAM